MPGIPDFTEHELDLVRQSVERRFRHPVDVEIADAELKLDPSSAELTTCPTLFWNVGDCNFVVFKIGADRFRPQFYYGHNEHYGTGRPEYTDLAECVTRLMQAQADQVQERKVQEPESARADADDADAAYWLPPTD
jgi:hypothetical protein